MFVFVILYNMPSAGSILLPKRLLSSKKLWSADGIDVIMFEERVS